MDNQPLQVSIFGKDYTLKSDMGEDHIRKIAFYLDKKMKMFAEQLSRKDPLKIAVLSALNIADELFREKNENETASGLAEQDTEEILNTLKNLEEEIKIVISD